MYAGQTTADDHQGYSLHCVHQPDTPLHPQRPKPHHHDKHSIDRWHKFHILLFILTFQLNTNTIHEHGTQPLGDA